MTPADTINRCLSVIREKWYLDKHERIFYRDKRMLTKAICRYGYACHKMGWEFQSPHITKEIITTLVRIESGDIKYLPVFLEECIDRSVGMRAEQLGEMDKLNKFQLTKRRRNKGEYADNGGVSLEKVIGRMRHTILPDSVVVVEKSDTEIMAALYKQLNTRRPKAAPVKQMALF